MNRVTVCLRMIRFHHRSPGYSHDSYVILYSHSKRHLRWRRLRKFYTKTCRGFPITSLSPLTSLLQVKDNRRVTIKKPQGQMCSGFIFPIQWHPWNWCYLLLFVENYTAYPVLSHLIPQVPETRRLRRGKIGEQEGHIGRRRRGRQRLCKHCDLVEADRNTVHLYMQIMLSLRRSYGRCHMVCISTIMLPKRPEARVAQLITKRIYDVLEYNSNPTFQM